MAEGEAPAAAPGAPEADSSVAAATEAAAPPNETGGAASADAGATTDQGSAAVGDALAAAPPAAQADPAAGAPDGAVVPPAAEEPLDMCAEEAAAVAQPETASASAAAVEGVEAVQHFSLADDDEDVAPRDLGSFLADVDDASLQRASRRRTPASSSSHSPAGNVRDDVPSVEGPAPFPTDTAGQIRERLKFLCPKDRQTVCRRECEVAKQREDALIKQIQQTIEQYRYALEVSGIVESTIAEEEEGLLFGRGQDGVPRSVMSPELVRQYEERIRLLQGFVVALGAEAAPTLPKLTALEQAKGAVFAGYAQTASVASRLGAQASTTTTAGASGARAVLSAFASRMRGGAGGGYPGGGGGGGGPDP